MSSEDYTEYTLPNGLVVAFLRTPTKTVSAELRVHFGASQEKQGEEGRVHFLEHCLYNAGNRSFSHTQVDDIVDTLGSSGAYTSSAHMSFEGSFLPEDLPLWLELTANQVFFPSFNPKRVEQEKKRILRETSKDKSDFEYLMKKEQFKLFYRGHPKGIYVLGDEKVIQSTQTSELKELHARGFYPNNMDLVIVGDLPQDIEEIILRHFGSVPAGKDSRKSFPSLPLLEKRHVLRYHCPSMKNHDQPQDSSATLELTFHSVPDMHPDIYNIFALGEILGGNGTTARLFNRLSMKEGLVYGISADHDGDFNAGSLNIDADVPAKKVDYALELIFNEIAKLKRQGISERSIKNLRKQERFNVAQVSTNNESQITRLQGGIDYGITVESYLEGWDAITPDSIKRAARTYLPDSNGKYIVLIKSPFRG